MKIWKLGEDCECQHEIKLKSKVIAIKYDNQTKTLAIMDNACQIGFIQRDFHNNKEVTAPQSVAASVDDDIDLN